ncbi:unnamed protein product [Scytosiphon promiscuus]
MSGCHTRGGTRWYTKAVSRVCLQHPIVVTIRFAMAGDFDEQLRSVPLGKATLAEERAVFAERMPLDIRNKPSIYLETRSEPEMTEAQHRRRPRESPTPPPAQHKRQQQQQQQQQQQERLQQRQQHHGRQQKVFVADDKFTDVIAALLQRGWVRSTNANSPNFNLKWRNLSNINFRLLRNDQFINHVFNSQQLSNKALLTGHLGFQYEHLRRLRQPQQLLEAPAAHCSPCSQFSKGEKGLSESPFYASDPAQPATAASGDILDDAANPECFFPRCWDVSDDGDGLCSALRAFAVSAGVALLRTAVNAQEKGRGSRSKDNGCDDGAAAAIAAATSVISRYISSLQSSKNTVSSKTPTGTGGAVSGQSPTQVGARRHVGLGCCGRDAADAAIAVGDAEFMAILKGWEAATVAAATAAEERAELEIRDQDHTTDAQSRPHVQEVSLAVGEELGSPVEKKEKEEGYAATTDGSDVASQEGHKEKKETTGAGLKRARKLLRTLDEDADLQAVLCLGPANAWVVKPAGSSCGRGVEVVSTLRGVVSACRRLEWKAVVQKYVERPLLVQGYKFDIRQWVLVTSCNPLVVWGFDESYVRFSSRPFTMDAPSLSDRLVHLCNHSVQKEQATGGSDHVHTGGQSMPLGSQGNMWRADQLRRHLRQRFEGKDVFQDVVLPRIRSVVVQTLLAVREGLEMKGRALEWLGFDLMLTEDLRVMLIEVNVSPDVSHSTPVTARLVPDATDHALDLLLDDNGADARATSTPLRELSPSHSSSWESVASMLPDEHPDAMPAPWKRPDTPPAADPDAGASSVSVGGRQTEKLGGVKKLRWRLWHKGEEESWSVLRGVREGKRTWFKARREKKRQRQGQRRASDSDGARFVENDRKMALAVVERLLTCTPWGDNGISDGGRDDRLSGRKSEMLPTRSYPVPISPQAVSPGVPSVISTSSRKALAETSIAACHSGHERGVRPRESAARKANVVECGLHVGRDLEIVNAKDSDEGMKETQDEEEDEL